MKSGIARFRPCFVQVYKLVERVSQLPIGLLLVTVNSEAQGVSIQSMLQNKAQEANEPRLTIALVREPFTDEKRTKW